MVTSSTSPRGAHHSTHAYLGKFYKYPIQIVYRSSKAFQAVHNRGRGYSNSFVNPAGVYRYTHTRISYHLGVGPFKRVPARMLPRHFAHSSVVVQRVAYLRGIRMQVRPRFQYSLKRCVQGPKPVLKSRSSTSQTVPQPYQNSELLRLLGFERGEVLGREGSVSPMCGCTLLLG